MCQCWRRPCGHTDRQRTTHTHTYRHVRVAINGWQLERTHMDMQAQCRKAEESNLQPFCCEATSATHCVAPGHT